LKERLGTKQIGYKHTGGVELFHQTDQAKFQGIIDELPALNQLMYEATGLKHTYSSVDIGMLSDHLLPLSIRNAYEGELNPVLMMDALYTKAVTMGVHIFKGVRVLNLDHEKHLGLLDNGEHIHFDKAVICTNSLARQFYPELDVSPAPNYVMYAYCPHDIGWESCYHMHDGYVYFRRIDSEFILIGGGRHILEHPMTDSEASKNQILSYLNCQLRQLIPKADFSIKGYWKGYLGVGAERMPIISEVEQDIYCAVRLGGMGVAIGSYLGNAVTELIRY
jgi:glycine/D-amino acid oxidase-like deaminating enzyme